MILQNLATSRPCIKGTQAHARVSLQPICYKASRSRSCACVCANVCRCVCMCVIWCVCAAKTPRMQYGRCVRRKREGGGWLAVAAAADSLATVQTTTKTCTYTQTCTHAWTGLRNWLTPATDYNAEMHLQQSGGLCAACLASLRAKL